MYQRLAALAAVLLVPSLAAAQTTPTTNQTVTGVAVDETNPPNTTPPIINIDECTGRVQDGLKFRWTIGDQIFTQGGGGGSWTLNISDKANCPTDNTANTYTLVSGLPANSTSGSYPLSGSYNVPAAMGNIGYGACPGSATVMNICVTFTPVTGATTTTITGSLQLDLARPPAPGNVVVSPADSGLKVSWSQGAGSPDAGTTGAANSYRAYYQPHVAGATPDSIVAAGQYATVTGAGTLSLRIDGLTNGTPYDVVVTALSVGLNESAPSTPVVTQTPVPILDFWRAYQNDGGRELGGCSSGAASLLALLALVPIAIGARRSSRRRS